MKELFERFFDYSHELFCIANTDGKFIQVNKAFEQILGYKQHELVNVQCTEFIYHDDKEKTLEQLALISTGKPTVDFENRYIHREGRIVFLQWRAHLDAETNTIFAVANDVTDKKRLESNYEQFCSAISNNVMLSKTDRNGIITEVNKEFCTVSQYGEEELVGKNINLLKSAVHNEAFYKELWSKIKNGEIWKGVITNKKRDGELFYVKTIINPIFSVENEIDSYISIQFDISEIYLLRKELAKNLQILNETNTIAKVGGWEFDLMTNKMSFTAEVLNILEVQKDFTQKPTLEDGFSFYVEEHKPIIQQAVCNAIEFGKPYSLELQIVTANGNKKWIHTNGKANYQNGKIRSISGTLQDVEEKKQAELVHNQGKQKSIQNAKYAALGDLAASIAHEINNPLGIISGYTELLQYNNMENAEEKLNIISTSCERIAHIVKNLKRFASNDSELQHSKVNLSTIVNDTMTLTCPKIKKNYITLETHIDENSYIWGNYLEIEQVLINIINNSIEAMSGSEQKRLLVRVLNNKNTVECHISDTGKGIPAEIRPKIYEPFFTYKSTGKSTGLGLSVVKEILDAHNAEIKLDNRSEETTFVISFPKI